MNSPQTKKHAVRDYVYSCTVHVHVLVHTSEIKICPHLSLPHRNNTCTDFHKSVKLAREAEMRGDVGLAIDAKMTAGLMEFKMDNIQKRAGKLEYLSREYLDRLLA